MGRKITTNHIVNGLEWGFIREEGGGEGRREGWEGEEGGGEGEEP